MLTAALLPGVRIRGLKGAVFAAATYGLLDFFLGWLLFVAIGLGTFGLGFVFAFVTRFLVTMILLRLTDRVSLSIQIRDGSTTFWAALVLSACSSVIHAVLT